MAYVFDKYDTLKEIGEDEREQASNDGSYIVIFDRGTTADSKAYWLYIAIPPNKYEEFLRLTVRRCPMRYEKYGKILHYGTGKEVPIQIQQQMKEKYGNDVRYQQWLEQEIEKAQKKFRKEKEELDEKRIADIVLMLKNNS